MEIRDIKSMEEKLASLIATVKPLDEEAMAKAKERQDYLAKPPGSLGKLEDISIKLAGITGEIYNSVEKQAIAVMCGDNGVVEEGVASAPQAVTLLQTVNMTRRITGVSALAKYFNFPLLVIDVGVADPVPEGLYTDDMVDENNEISKLIVNRRLANGTKNLAKESSMTREDALAAILIGIEAVESFKKAGIELFGVGEMGIGNTTTSSTVLKSITGASAEEVVGRGGGLTDEGLSKKVSIVESASKRTEGKDPIGILSEVGGYDICAMVGAFLGAGIYRIPVVIDGLISIVSALVAKELCPTITDFMFTSHKSYEIGYVIAIEKLGLFPMFDLGMRLGEGSGCPIAFKIIEAATAAMNHMKLLSEASIEASYLDEIREKNLF